MRTALVTGVAGFIGSNLAEQLIEDGWRVIGVDAFTPYYDVATKKSNLRLLRSSRRFAFLHADLDDIDMHGALSGADVVFHLAAQPGVRPSWRDGFGDYLTNNVHVTQRLLEASVRARVERFVYASSSSVYGNAARYPTEITDVPRPHSPYGVSKLAAEHLCTLYADNYGLSTVSLRFFTVYGPRQRPDMAIHRMAESALTGSAFPLYGDGSQVRDFTYVSDVADACIAAGVADVPGGSVFNVAGGSSVVMRDLIELVGDTAGAPVVIERMPEQRGDVRETGGSIEATTAALRWAPRVSLEAGVAAQVDWHRSRHPTLTAA